MHLHISSKYFIFDKKNSYTGIKTSYPGIQDKQKL